tara:strand:+ start:475 stop:987 length:513 start_codon:yes stop_codon:yes gene_type:complete
MEWLGILILYLVSGFLKKRQNNQKRREIESDPDWDSDTNLVKEPSNNIEQLFNDLFEQNPKVLKPDLKFNEIIDETTENLQIEDIDVDIDEPLNEFDNSSIENLSKIDNQRERFEENIYHSELAEREELHFGNKWLTKKRLKDELFKSNQSLRKSIIIKEILDKPLSMRS